MSPNSWGVRCTPLKKILTHSLSFGGFAGEASSTCFIFQSICNRGAWSVTMTTCAWSHQSTWSLWACCPLSWQESLTRSRTAYPPPPSFMCPPVASHCVDYAKCLGRQTLCSQSSHGQWRTRTNHGTTASMSTWRWKTRMWWTRPVLSVMMFQVKMNKTETEWLLAKICILCVRVKVSKHSFELFCVRMFQVLHILWLCHTLFLPCYKFMMPSSSFFYIFFSFSFSASLSLAGTPGCLTWVRHRSCKSSATHSCQHAVFFCAQTIMVWLPVFGIFLVHTDVDAWNCTLGCMDTIR